MLVIEILHLTQALNSHQQRLREQTSLQLLQVFLNEIWKESIILQCVLKDRLWKEWEKNLAMELYYVSYDPARNMLDFITSEFHTTPLQVAAKIRPRPS